jgi:hypothetical protein
VFRDNWASFRELGWKTPKFLRKGGLENSKRIVGHLRKVFSPVVCTKPWPTGQPHASRPGSSPQTRSGMRWQRAYGPVALLLHRKRGTEYGSDSGAKWTSGSATQRCGGAPLRTSSLGSVASAATQAWSEVDQPSPSTQLQPSVSGSETQAGPSEACAREIC